MERGIVFRLVTFGNTYEELQIEDDDGLLVENGKQQDLDINDVEQFSTDMKYDCIDTMMPP